MGNLPIATIFDALGQEVLMIGHSITGCVAYHGPPILPARPFDVNKADSHIPTPCGLT